jgi:7-keto-8-aminopelargonate synthetase-like enzyme
MNPHENDQEYREYLQTQLNKLWMDVFEKMDEPPECKQRDELTLRFIEFTHNDYVRLSESKAITQEDIDNVDIDKLAHKLQRG